MRGYFRAVEFLYYGNSAHALQQSGPISVFADADRGNGTNPGDDDTSHEMLNGSNNK